jgi:hypothetical protein
LVSNTYCSIEGQILSKLATVKVIQIGQSIYIVLTRLLIDPCRLQEIVVSMAPAKMMVLLNELKT